jgi:hypothetical protein
VQVEADAVVADAKTILGRVDAVKPFDVAGAGFGEALDGLLGPAGVALCAEHVRQLGEALIRR